MAVAAGGTSVNSAFSVALCGEGGVGEGGGILELPGCHTLDAGVSVRGAVARRDGLATGEGVGGDAAAAVAVGLEFW